jgi:hypothetical protein
LREKDKHHGVLLLVHQKARPQGWENGANRYLTFPQVVCHLKSMAREMWSAGAAASRAEIAAIDVSDIAIAPVGKQKASKAYAPKTKTRKL